MKKLLPKLFFSLLLTSLLLSIFGVVPTGILPLLAAQILWINLAEDSLPNFALAFEKGEHDVMSRPPTPRDMPIVNLQALALMLGVSIATSVLLLGIFIWMQGSIPLDEARTIVFAASGIDSLFYILSIRKLSVPIWKSKPWENPWMPTAILAGLGLMFSAIYLPPLQAILQTVPLSFGDLGIVAIYVAFGVLLFEMIKIILGLLDEKERKQLKIYEVDKA